MAAMHVQPGMRLRSAVCSSELIVVKASESEFDLRCGGAPLSAEDTSPAAAQAAEASGSGTMVGKRYVDDDGTIELLCVKGGDGSLSIGEVPMGVRNAKPLPSSD